MVINNLNQLSKKDITFINASLLNDESSIDEDVIKHFIKELNISENLSKLIVSYRELALNDMCFNIKDCGGIYG